MNKSKILKILSLSTLGIGAISGVTVALTACNNDSDNTTTKIDLGEPSWGKDFTAITVNATAPKLADLVAAINTAITAKYSAWTTTSGQVDVYKEDGTTKAVDTDFINNAKLSMIITANAADKNFTGTSKALAFTLTVSPASKIDISKSNDDLAKITAITSVEKDLNKLNDAIVIQVKTIPALKDITSADLKIDVKKGTAAAVPNDIVDKASLTFQLTAQGDKYTGSSSVITFTFNKQS